jgi:hypothetical protein
MNFHQLALEKWEEAIYQEVETRIETRKKDILIAKK